MDDAVGNAAIAASRIDSTETEKLAGPRGQMPAISKFYRTRSNL